MDACDPDAVQRGELQRAPSRWPSRRKGTYQNHADNYLCLLRHSLSVRERGVLPVFYE